jgi:hypothetical protein
MTIPVGAPLFIVWAFSGTLMWTLSAIEIAHKKGNVLEYYFQTALGEFKILYILTFMGLIYFLIHSTVTYHIITCGNAQYITDPYLEAGLIITLFFYLLTLGYFASYKKEV